MNDNKDELYANLLNTADSFWSVYRSLNLSKRKQHLLDLFKRYPGCKLPVNNRWQANLKDKDLSALVKKGILVKIRDGVGRRHYMNKSSNKRQTYLMLAV